MADKTERPVIAAVGAGRMGRGLAHVFAYADHEVRLVDAKARNPEEFATLAADAIADVRRTVSLMAAFGLISGSETDSIVERVSVHSRDDAAVALAGASVIFEGVPEVQGAKREAFAFMASFLFRAQQIALRPRQVGRKGDRLPPPGKKTLQEHSVSVPEAATPCNCFEILQKRGFSGPADAVLSAH